MNGTLLALSQPMDIVPISPALILAQNSPQTNPLAGILELNPTVGGISLLDLVMAVLIFVIGSLVAWIISNQIGKWLHRTSLDNQIATWIRGRPSTDETLPMEKWISTAVFWVLMIFVLVAFFNTLKLTAVSVPLNTFLNQITGFLPQLGAALVWLGVAWIVATIVKMAVTRGLRAFGLDERLNQEVGTTPSENQLQLSETLANALYWFILLLFLPLILEALGLQQALEPVKNLLDQILAALPKILKATIIGAAGWLLAQIVRRIVTNLLAATGTDQLGARFGMSRTSGTQSLSGIVGTIVYVLILIPVATASLQALEIEAISAPAITMLNKILGVIPQIFTAAIILIVAYVIGQFVCDLITNILTGIGFNNIFAWLGMPAAPQSSPETESDPASPNTVIQSSVTRTPSEIVGIIALVGIMLFATMTATDILKLAALTGIIQQIIVILGRVILGVVVFGIGLYFANLAFSLIVSSGSRQSHFLGQAARTGIIIFVTAMALQQMGIGSDIVNLAFGLLLGAIAVAIALAFGLGGRDIAASQIREWLSSFKQNQNSD